MESLMESSMSFSQSERINEEIFPDICNENGSEFRQIVRGIFLCGFCCCF